MRQKKLKSIISLSFAFFLVASIFSTSIVAASDGISVEQDTSEKPSLDVLYYPGSMSDPWKGGNADFVWKDSVVPTLGFAGLEALAKAKDGLNFAARITLPNRITAKDVVDSIDYNNSYLYVGSASPYKLDPGFFSYDNPTDGHLYFTMRKGASFFKLVEWLTDIIKSILGSGKSALDVKLVAKIDVSKLSKNGYPDIDKSPNQLLTKGMAPPNENKKLDFKVNFYGYKQITWDSNKNAHPKAGQEDANPALDSFPTWNAYISPWDTELTFNTEKYDGGQNWEKVTSNGTTQDTFLPGPFENRVVSMNTWEDNDIDKVGERFNRVVNIFTQEDVTSTAVVSHNNDTLITSPGGIKRNEVTFSGYQKDNTLLSPVTTTFIKNDEALSVELDPSAKRVYGLGESITAPIDFTEMDENAKKLSVKITDNLMTSTADSTAVEVTDPGNEEHANIALPNTYSSKTGQHTTKLTFTDDFGRTETVDYQYTVLDLPTFNGRKILSTDSNSSLETLTINPGENVKLESVFTPKVDATMMLATIKATLPESTQLVSGSTKVEAKVPGKNKVTIPVADSAWKDGKFSYNLMPKVLGEQNIPVRTPISVKYEVSTSKEDRGKTLSTGTDTLESVSGQDGQYHVIGTTNNPDIYINPGELRFESATDNANFGQQDVPDSVTTYTRQSPDDFSVKIFDSYNDKNFNWTLTSQLIGNGLTNSTGDVLKSRLLLNQDEQLLNKYPGLFSNQLVLLPGQPQTVYTNNIANNGDLNFSWPMDKGPALEVSNDQRFVDDNSYAGVVQWSLDAGPNGNL
ncbi:hypothetical protein RD055328_11270 [Companilactobacillus sp. RD055328]|uniref:hypothetical protein n=1 Tax=Companilactobacillus sp. RD055328 TaxID=2916634 RepID=UPI001FC899F4|nr:hypothetical protein [Companilactobacillus sp. RD055328]GKQ43204.1 hypothetical protein RD055328_11270 [Companilactobacillus sp. RD055328]